MKISNERKIKDLQKEFSQQFPFLQIRFFKEPIDFGQMLKKNEELNPELSLGKIRMKKNVGIMPMSGDQKVGNFEQQFSKSYGLNVQVYRKSYSQWLQTWATDVWTLSEQNERSRIMGNKPGLIKSA